MYSNNTYNVLVSLAQLVGIIYKICKVWGSNPGYYQKKNNTYNIEKLLSVTPTLNVSRKFSVCIIFSTGYIKIYNIKLQWINTSIQIRTFNTTILEILYICLVITWIQTIIFVWYEHVLNDDPLSYLHNVLCYIICWSETKRIGMRHNVLVSST